MKEYCQLTGDKYVILELRIIILFHRDKFFVNEKAGMDCQRVEHEKAEAFNRIFGSKIIKQFREVVIQKRNT